MKFEWDDKSQSSFDQLKKILVGAPMLTQLSVDSAYVGYRICHV